MKLFRRGREGLLFDENSMAFHWSFDQTHALHGLATLQYNSGATTAFRVGAIGAGALGTSRADFALPAGTVQGSVKFGNVWTASSPSLMHYTAAGPSLGTTWSLMFWAKTNQLATSSTFCLMEYAYGPSPAAAREVNMLGVYTDQGTRRLHIRWDISTTTTQVINTPITIGAGGDHIAMVCNWTTPTGLPSFEVWKNGQLGYSAASVWAAGGGTVLSGHSSNWSLGGSYRYGLSTTTAALVSGVTAGEDIALDDVGFFNRAITPGKIRETYGNAVRTWDEEILLKSGQYRVAHRVLVQDGSEWVDMSSYRGRDWTVTASISNNVEDDWQKAKVSLRRRFGRFLDLSRTNTESSTYDGAAGTPLIDLRSRIRIEYALVPTEWEIQGWEWTHAFDGFVDSMDWGRDLLELDLCDRAAALGDVFRVDARRYEYGPASTTRSGAHLQTLINDNVPQTIRSGAIGGFTLWGYLGGTPAVYTPVTDSWIQRYEHGGTGTVLKLLQGVADQIGWDVRYRPYWPLSEDRLTYFEPPRNLSLTLNDIREDANGRAIVKFPFPHGLQVGQSIEVSDVPNDYSQVGTVLEVPTWNKIVTSIEPAATPAAESTGNVEFGPHFTLRAANVFDVGRVSARVDDIRNHIIIKYNRENSAATYFVSAMYDDGGTDLIVELPEDVDVSPLQAGQEASITSPDAGFSGVRAIAAISGNAVQLTPGNVVGSSTSGLFYSEYLSFNQVVRYNTASISRFGLRSAGVFEGSIEGIDTQVEALQLASGMLSDMSNPTVDLTATVTCIPHIDLHDLLALEADPLGRWSAMNVAVVGYTHNFGPTATTDLQLRHDHPSKGRAWLNRGRGLSLDVPGNWGLPNRNIDIGFDTGFDFDMNPDIGPYFMSAWTPMKGKASWLQDRTEMHLSTTSSGFIPRPTTMVDSTRGQAASTMGTAAGRFSPGTTYFVQFRHRDKWGNVSGTHSGATVGYTMRFLPKTSGAKTTIVSSNTVRFVPGVWNAVFGIKSATGGYDPYNNYFSYAPVAGSVPPTVASSTASYFTMPCTGMLNVEGRIGLRCDGKDTQQVALGLFIRNSAKPGSGTDKPFLYPKITLEAVPSTTMLVQHPGESGPDRTPGFLMGSATHTVNYARNHDFGVPLATVAYAIFSENISANSGDQVLIGIRPETSAADFMLHPTVAETTASTGYVRYTLLGQDPEATGS